MQTRQAWFFDTELKRPKVNTFRSGYFWIESNFLRHTIANTSNPTSLVVFIDETPLRKVSFSNDTSVISLYDNLSYHLAENGVYSILYTPSDKEVLTSDKEPNTLDLQTEKLVNLLETFFENYGVFENITLIGLGNGAHIAVGAIAKTRIKKFKISRLILLSPPAYPERIEHIQFGLEFENKLASFAKLRNAPIFEKLKRFCLLGRDLMLGFSENNELQASEEVRNHFLELHPKIRNYRNRVKESRRGAFKTIKLTGDFQKPNDKKATGLTNEIIDFICSDAEQ